MATARDLVNRFSDVKTLPHVALKVNELARSESSTMSDFEEIIKMDPVLVTRLLRLVNSSFYGLNKKVESISRAVAFVGMKELNSLVAVEAVKDFFKEHKEIAGFSRKNLWVHSSTVAILGQMIAKRIFGQEGEDVFLAGILHDIGLIVEDQVVGDLLRNAIVAYREGRDTLIKCEKEFIGTDHCLVGALLTEGWNLPTEILDAVWRHHRDINQDSISSVAGIVQLAEFFSARLKYAVVPGRIPPLPSPSLAMHVKQRLADYKAIVEDLPSELARAREVFDLDE